MKTNKKVIKVFDQRQKDFQATQSRLDTKKRLAYRKPGSRNPRKHGA